MTATLPLTDRRRIILASAGTGKTWQLSTRAIELLLAGVAPERILATTFTRKAAGEILERILVRLAKACDEPGERRTFRDASGRTPEPEVFLALLARLARGIHRLRVSTLDAFFVELAQALGPELDLPAGWRIADELEDERLRADAVHAVLERVEALERFVLLQELQRRTGARRVHAALLEAVGSAAAYAEESEEPAWSRIRAPAEVDPAVLERALSGLRKLPPPLTRAGRPDGRFQKALDPLAAAAERGDWRALLGLTLAKRVLSGNETYGGAPIPESIAEVVRTLGEHAAHVHGATLVAQTRATWRLCARFEQEHERLRRASGLWRFDAIARAVAGGREGRAPALEELFERLDGALDHVLLDEFQDTSPAQFRALRPLIVSAADSEREEKSFFCVGDPKQSIYGWRRAEPRLLESLPGRLGIEPSHLARNYRSSPVVLDAVNRLFSTLGSNPALEEREVERAVAQRFAERFDEHTAHRADLPGRFVVRTAPAKEGSAAGSPCIELAARRASELARAAPGRTIAILLRRRARVAHAIYALRELGIAASEAGGNPLVDSSAVLAALALLEFADHPEDTAAHFHAASSPFAAGADLALGDGAPQRAEKALALRRRLVERGFAALLDELRPRVRASFGAWDRARFEQLVELALSWEPRASLRPSDFVARVRSQRVESAVRAPVQVMTIHAAKGLEFDAVLLPELELHWSLHAASLVARRLEDDPLLDYEVVSRGGDAALRARMPELEALYQECRSREALEALCALYVATTRAVHHLEIIVPPPTATELKSGKRPLSSASLVRAAFAPDASEPDAVIFEHPASSDAWATRAEAAAATETPRTEEEPALGLAPAGEPRELPRRTPSSHAPFAAGAAGGSFAGQRIAPRTGAQARLRGLRLHLWLREVEWLEEFAASDAQLRALASERGLGGPGLDADLCRFRECLASPAARSLLSRAETARRLGASARDLRVWRERAFAHRVEDAGEGAHVAHGAFDRAVVAAAHSGTSALIVAAHAEVIDFKSDALDPAEASVRARGELYRPQLDAYRDALARIAGLERGAIAARILFVDAARVCEL